MFMRPAFSDDASLFSSPRGAKRKALPTMAIKKLNVVPLLAADEGYLLDEQIGFLLRVAMQRHTSIFGSRMLEGLTQTQFAALAKLYEVGPCSQNQLGRLIYLDAATIKGVVDRLSLRRLVTVVSDTRDRRRRAVALTPRGREVTAAAINIADEITAQTLAPLSSDEQMTLRRLLNRLN
jgi:DNA-binding MarR family transcriptional regulator